MRVTFIDTSVLCELLEVPGKNQQAGEVQREFAARDERGERFVIPITAVIETGNHIAQAARGRRLAAERLVGLLRATQESDGSYVLNQVSWDSGFLDALCRGNGTEQSFVDLAGNGLMGTGDVAILVERDRFVAESGYARRDVEVWTLEAVMGAYS